MIDLDTLLTQVVNMPKVSKKPKPKQKALTPQQKAFEAAKYRSLHGVGSGCIKNPWVEESMTLIKTIVTCTGCGNEGVSWNPHVFITRKRTVKGREETHTEKVEVMYTEEILPMKRNVEVLESSTCCCPQCFNFLPSSSMAAERGAYTQTKFEFKEKKNAQ